MSKIGFRFSKPAVFASGAVIAEAIIMLSFPQYKEILLICIIGVAVIACMVLFREVAAVFISVMLILGACLTYNAYKSGEEHAAMILEALGKSEHTYSGEVTYFSGSKRPTVLRIKITSIDKRTLQKPFSAQITSFAGDTASVGDTVVFQGTPSPLTESDNNDFDTKNYLRSKNVFIVFPSANVISTSKNNEKALLAKLRESFDSAVHTYIKSDYSYTSDAIVKALTLGDKTDFSKEMSQSFSKSGLSHLMCVSGMHLCVMLGMISCILVRLTIPKKLRCLILIGFCLFYIFFTGASASVIRAGIMSAFTYTAFLLGRKSDAVIALFCSGAFMVFVNPYVVLDVSARLSFAATLGVILAGNAADQLFPVFSVKHPVCFGFISAVMTNFCAIVFTLPLSADSFGGFSTVGMVSTLFTSLACEFLIIFANILCFLSLFPFTDLVCLAIGNVCKHLAQYIMEVSNYFSSFRYSYVKVQTTHLIFILSMIFITLLCVFISLGSSKKVRIMLSCVIVSSVLLYTIGIINAVKEDSRLCVSYYRKNENDRQLAVKLGTDGHIIFNADDLLCTNPQKAMFDSFDGMNYIVLLPDENTDTTILAQSILSFSSRYGIRAIFVPDTSDGKLLSESLSAHGIVCKIFPDTFSHSQFTVSFSCIRQDSYSITVSDKSQEVFVVFSDNYQLEDFKEHHDICAFFTRKTKTQFNPDKHEIPDCNLFITRTKKDYSASGMFNTFGKTSFMLKE